MKFILAVAGSEGWERFPIEIDVPSEILELETLERAGFPCPNGSEGKIKGFWREVVGKLREERGLQGMTHVLFPAREEC